MDTMAMMIEPPGLLDKLDTESRTPQSGQDRRASARLKLVIEISPDLHQRIIAICATRRVPVNRAVREVLEHAFPS